MHTFECANSERKTKAARNNAPTYQLVNAILGILRLYQALARLRFLERAVSNDVDEFSRLIERLARQVSLYTESRDGADQIPSSKIYNLIRAMKDSVTAAVGDGGELSI